MRVSMSARPLANVNLKTAAIGDERRVEALMKEGVSLGELRDRCELPEFARWDQYETLHPQNVNRTYLRLEWSQFK
jgi:hypothetical protein